MVSLKLKKRLGVGRMILKKNELCPIAKFIRYQLLEEIIIINGFRQQPYVLGTVQKPEVLNQCHWTKSVSKAVFALEALGEDLVPCFFQSAVFLGLYLHCCLSHL